jgi:putative transposase
MPLHVIQMDNTSLDLFPVDENSRQTLPTPFMTAAIDCYTGMITGFTVSYFASSSQSVIEVLVQSILPKDSYKRDFETQHDWPICGFPVVVLVDNGMDYRSKSLMDFCIKNRIILEFAPIRKPRFKAYIEQWFRVLKDAIRQESVPGFRPSLKQRIENPEIKPENEAMLT